MRRQTSYVWLYREDIFSLPSYSVCGGHPDTCLECDTAKAICAREECLFACLLECIQGSF
ncbi:hypothetical protein CSUI_010150 [Cystoisospora suis]|uniref:Uncharacterized protein n=1 Tax=Cystoisospora suis TaxID=483139 RepID=A0A2C6KHB0_9APIC|nr:hypothetical protein CSUI_010150 [Cystoisospora suis]